MKTLWTLLAAAVVFVTGSQFIMAQEKEKAEPRVVKTTRAEMTATVADIDYKNRTMTLEGPDGNTVTVRVDPNLKNFDELKKGDRVQAEYYQSVAVSVQKPGERPVERRTTYVEVPQPGEKPKRVEAKITQTTATIEDIDYANRTATLKNPRGTTVTIHVDPRVTNLEQFKKGDRILITNTEAIAVHVQKE